MRVRKGFTLIELLIVVAIIAILAAIAVPNFLEAQIRSKVSRVKADMRTLATGIESYATDNNKPPTTMIPGGGFSGQSVLYPEVTSLAVSPRFIWLTTPISYMTSVLRDPFVNIGRIVTVDGNIARGYDTYDYVCALDFEPPDVRGGGITSGAIWLSPQVPTASWRSAAVP